MSVISVHLSSPELHKTKQVAKEKITAITLRNRRQLPPGCELENREKITVIRKFLLLEIAVLTS